MKEKIILFLVGLLLGAIISTGSIFIYTLATNSNTNNNSNQTMQMPGNGTNPGEANGGSMPSMPGNNTTSSN